MALLVCGVLFSGGARVWAATPVSCASPASAQQEPTEYFVSLTDHAEHLAHVSLRLLDVPATWSLRDVHVLGGADPGKVEQVVAVANNYDELADSPAEIGMFGQSEFRQDGATYHVVVDGDPADYDMAKLDALLGRITHAAVDWMQDRP